MRRRWGAELPPNDNVTITPRELLSELVYEQMLTS